MRVGYLWVGPLEHSADYQRDLLDKRGVDVIFEDISPRTVAMQRPRLTDALDRIDAGDTLVVWRLDRLGTTTSNVLALLELLSARGVAVECIAENLDTAGPHGAALLEIIAAITSLERSLQRERTLVGVYAARARGRTSGRPRALSDTNIDRVRMLRDQGASVREIAEELGTSRATIYRVLDGGRDEEDRPTLTVRLPSLDAGAESVTDG
ncbi:recombinase family protein [Galbitalea sp. SE-J8]|uniref:recombinase family protein n=1 Tax=Galbitalea sp. SE-J8 TaxID=3054952 RepID=UPI00259D0A77|nr:recombinase family protein [Galbitalea sp. SE-J8]MDM4763055.1 recombinase family protein [Galbitalea sp. SE-J8]